MIDLRKRYGKSPIDAVAGLSFAVTKGEVFGLLGPNGAGKTTTVGVLTTRICPTAGTASLSGIDVVAEPARARALLGVVPQRNNLDRSLSIRQNLTFHASYHRIEKKARDARAEELLLRFGLAERADHKPDYVSGGQAQRMMIARALMHDPAVLFLDEPSTGLDPAARLFVWERIRELRAAGTTVVLTTHDMDEAATLCDRVGVVDHGRLIALGAPSDLISQLPGERTLDVQVALGDVDVEECRRALASIPAVVRVQDLRPGPAVPVGIVNGAFGPGATTGPLAGRCLNMRLAVVGGAPAAVAPVAAAVSSLGARVSGLSILEPNLEDVFIHLTGSALQ